MQAAGFDLGAAAAGVGGVDGAGGKFGALDADLAGDIEGLKGRGDGDLGAAEETGIGVFALELIAVELEIVEGFVAEIGIVFDPMPVVDTDDAGVGGATDGEPDASVDGADGEAGHSVVTLSGEAGGDGGVGAVVAEGGDDAEAVLVAMGDVDFAVGDGEPAAGAVDFEAAVEEVEGREIGEVGAGGVDGGEGAVGMEAEVCGVEYPPRPDSRTMRLPAASWATSQGPVRLWSTILRTYPPG